MLTHRSYETELLDEATIPAEAFGLMLHEINIINTRLGGHAVTLKGLKKFNPHLLPQPIRIAEIGSGGGDNLKTIYDWCSKRNISVELTGIDIRPECVEYAIKHTAGIPINYIVSDYKLVVFPEKPDIIFNSLFCHHFNEDELIFMMQWMKQNTQLGFFINDLHRHYLAYSSIKLLTQLFGKSEMVKNDAPISVKRGFLKNEWKQILQQAGINDASIDWNWAFRHLIIGHNKPV